MPSFTALHPCRNSPMPPSQEAGFLSATPLGALTEHHGHAVGGVGSRAWVHSPESDRSEGDRNAIREVGRDAVAVPQLKVPGGAWVDRAARGIGETVWDIKARANRRGASQVLEDAARIENSY